MIKIKTKKYLIILVSLLLSIVCFISILAAFNQASAENSVEQQTNDIYNNMSEKERICQTFMAHFKRWGGTTFDDSKPISVVNDDIREIIENYHFGSVLLYEENIPTTESTFHFLQDIQLASTTPLTSGQQKGLPVLFEIDQEGGTVFRLETGTNMIGNMSTGATRDSQCAIDAARIFAEEFKAIGLNYDDCPCIDVNSNAGNPIINLRSYGDDANKVAELGDVFTKSLYQNGILSCIKHFPGHGDVDVDSHKGLPISNKTWNDLSKSDLIPFKKCIPDTKMIMTAHIQFPNVINEYLECDTEEHKGETILAPATLSHTLITDKLKNELGFKGIAVTDALNMDGIALYFTDATACKYSLAAGDDMLCIPMTAYNKKDYIVRIENVIKTISDWSKENESNAARLEDAVKNVIRTKVEMGITEYNPNDYSLEKAQATLRCPEHLSTEYKDAAKAITVVKNNNNTLPIKLDNNSKVLFLCQNPSTRNEDGVSAVAWNRLKAVGLVPEGATANFITFSGDEDTGKYNITPSWNQINNAIVDADIVIVDSCTNSNYNNGYLGWRTDAPNKMVTYAHNHGKKAIVLSKRFPYDCQLYPDADAILLTYNHVGTSNVLNYQTILDNNITVTKDVSGPNTIEAVEAIFGNINITGTLPVNIPEFNYNPAKPGYNNKIIYSNGYGLTYNQVLNLNNTNITFDYNGVDQSKPIGQDNMPKTIVSTNDSTITYSSGDLGPNKPVSFTIPIAREQKTFTEGVDYTTSLMLDADTNKALLTINATPDGNLVGSKTVSLDVSSKPAQTGDMLPFTLVGLFILTMFTTIYVTKCKTNN